jgi:hypothetical protein
MNENVPAPFPEGIKEVTKQEKKATIRNTCKKYQLFCFLYFVFCIDLYIRSSSPKNCYERSTFLPMVTFFMRKYKKAMVKEKV